MKKRAISFILILLLAFSLVPAPAFAATTIASGYCGDSKDGKNVKWTLNDEGLMIITGKGGIKDYAFDAARSSGKLDTDYVETVVVGNGVTSIGKYAFQGFTNVTTILFAKTVTSIEDGALQDLAAKRILLQDGITHIGANVFGPSLKEVWISTVTIKSISDSAFRQCCVFDSITGEYRSTIDNILYHGNIEILKSAMYPGKVFLMGSEWDGDVELSPVNIRGAIMDSDYVYNFIDVPSNHVYARAIHWAVAHNIAWGTSEATFSPDATCTRGQVVTFLWRFSGQPEPTINVNPFTDVNESDYFYKPVLWAVEQGITSGTTPTSFSPNAKCSYAHIGTFLWRAAGKQAPTNERYSHDLWYGDALNWDIDTLKAGYLYKNIKPMSDCPRGVVIQGIKDLDTYFDHLDDEPSTTDE